MHGAPVDLHGIDSTMLTAATGQSVHELGESSRKEKRLALEKTLSTALSKLKSGEQRLLARAVYMLRGAVSEAREFEQEDPLLLGRALGNLGNALEQMHKSTEAVGMHLECLEVMKSLGKREKQAHILGNLSVSYESLEKWDKALDCLQRQMALTEDEALIDQIAEAIEDIRLQKAHSETEVADDGLTSLGEEDATVFTGTEGEDGDHPDGAATTDFDNTHYNRCAVSTVIEEGPRAVVTLSQAFPSTLWRHLVALVAARPILMPALPGTVPVAAPALSEAAD